ncbi:MAG: hypothetical protein JW932_10120 [Deltaproteobacteria bacterium]|nr:hypothetical protein [Deltaproteobacteria bacterium]
MERNNRLNKVVWPIGLPVFMGLLVISILFLAAATPQNIHAASSGLPLTTFMSDDFAGSGQCAMCHSLLRDRGGEDVSIDAHWRSTLMANSAKDPLWQAKVSSEIARHPQLQTVIEDKCATCHMPMGRTQALIKQLSIAILEDGFLDSNHPFHEAAFDGVSCTLCHQIQAWNLGEMASFSGHYAIDSATVPPNRLIFGPYSNPIQNMMRNNVGFTPARGPQVEDSALCGACHTLYTPYVNADGKVLGEFPEQTPYLEWKHSEYEKTKTCQQCHMPEANGSVVISNRPRGRGLTARSPFNQHYFIGGNSTMLTLLAEQNEELGISASSKHLETTLARTLEQLHSDTAQLAVIDTQIKADTLNIVLQVKNLVGHKFPTGFPSRRAWIHLRVKDADGHIVFESGKPRDDGSITENDADLNAGAFEPHYNRISKPEQVQIYEGIMRNSDGNVTYTLLRGAGYIKDNRLLPRGFEKATSPDDIAIWGMATSDTNFQGGTDQVLYELDISGKSGPYVVAAELMYQTLSFPFIRDLLQDHTEQEDRFANYYADLDKKPVIVTGVNKTVP